MGAATVALAGLSREHTASAQTSLSPDAALQRLIDGNKRFAEGRMTLSGEDLKVLRAKTVDEQEPYAAVLSCVDSRVPVELIFDQSIGQVFVTRVAGNIATTATIASLEYGVAVLGTKAIIVLGHADCGAIKATIGAKAEPGQISALYPLHSPGSQSGRSQSGGGRQGQCQHPGRAAPAILARARRSNQAEPAQNRRRVL
jgi:carbonic anhydrase